MLKVTIITIGDEICIGQVTNSNAAWIATQLVNIGALVLLHSVIRDEKNIIISELERCLGLSDVVIITGGLGPTHDDITKSTLCDFFGDKLILHNPTLNHIKNLFEKRGINISDRNSEQALIPSKCAVLENLLGTAPGLLFDYQGKYIFALPGVPREMMEIVGANIIPFLEKINYINHEEIILYKTLHTSGIPESSLADLIGPPENFLNGGTLAFLPSYQGVRLRIGVVADNKINAKKKIKKIINILEEKIGKYIFSASDDSLSSTIGKILIKKNQTLSVVESCTGGLLGSAITDNPGCSKYFVGGLILYNNVLKIKLANIDKSVLDIFGAVSEETAISLAMNTREKLNSDFCISITGVAGPSGGSIDKPVGTVWIGIAGHDFAIARKFLFANNRHVNRERAVGTALRLLYENIK